MQYMGGKARIAKKLADTMLSMTTERTYYLEPFMGGAYVLAQMAPHFSAPAAGDTVEDLVLFWQAVQAGWLPPERITRDEYAELAISAPSPLRAFAGFGCSFGGKWFAGYAAQKVDPRHPHGHTSVGSRKSTVSKVAGIQNVFISQGDYRQWKPGPGTVVYCDPPYAGTTTYGAADTWDPHVFWATMRQWVATGATVFVSEYTAPEDWHCIWQKDQRASLAADTNVGTVTEKLFTR